MGMEKLTCIFDANAPKAYITCFDLLSGGLLWNSVYFAVMFICVAGWAYTLGIEKGMMVGAFFAVLLGIGMFAMGALSIVSLLFGVLVLLAGIFIAVLSR